MTGEEDMSPSAACGRDMGGMAGVVCQEVERSMPRSGMGRDVWEEIEKALRGLLEAEDGTLDMVGEEVTDMTTVVLTCDLSACVNEETFGDERAALGRYPSFQ